jgi:ribokinase
MQSICIFGVFVADICFYSEKIPIKGETVLGIDHLVGPGGKGSNQAIAAARLNGKVNFITKMGDDSHSDMAFKIYKDSGVITDSITKDKNLSTGVAGIMIANDGSNAINIVPGAAAQLNNKDIDNNIGILKKSKIFLTQMETPDEVTIYSLKKSKRAKFSSLIFLAGAGFNMVKHLLSLAFFKE